MEAKGVYKYDPKKAYKRELEDFTAVQKAAILKRDDNDPSKFAFVISTKISKLAVHRNRIKRSMNEGIRRNLRDIPKGYDFVFLTKRSIGGKTTEEIIEEVGNFFSRLNLNL